MGNKEIALKKFEDEYMVKVKGGQKAIEQGTFEYKYSGSNNIDEVAWYLNNSYKNFGFCIVRTI